MYGEDDFLKESAVKQLVDAAVDAATRDFNLDVRQGGELDAETLGTLLSTPPMMAERRVVVVRDAGALKKDARAWLDDYLERTSAAPEGAGAADVVLVLVLSYAGWISWTCESTAARICLCRPGSQATASDSEADALMRLM